MKKLLTLAIATLLFTTGCEKETAKPEETKTPTHYFKFKVDGKEYAGSNSNGNKGDDGKHLSLACAFTYNDVLSTMGVFAVYSGPKTYSDSMTTSLLLNVSTAATYHHRPKTPVTVKVISEDNTGMKGEFSGVLYNYDDSTKTIKITDGSFYVPITY